MFFYKTIIKNNILYIGRFQPFHKGHADAILQILEDIKHNNVSDDSIQKYNIFIGIGSAETNFTESNPLTSGERFEIINEACSEILATFLENNTSINTTDITFHIVPIRNINHYALWPQHVQQYLPEIDTLYSGSPLVIQLWENSFLHKKTVQIKKRIDISGTKIRNLLLPSETIPTITLQKKLEKYCLPSTISLLQKFKLPNRLNNMKTY